MSREVISSGTKWESIAGYSRVVRVGQIIEVAGTTAIDEKGEVVGEGDVATQTRFILEKIKTSLAATGAEMEDIVRTRIYLIDITHWEEVAKVHGEYFSKVLPVCTMVQIAALIDSKMLIEIEATAIDAF